MRYWSQYKLKPAIKLRTVSIEAIRNLVARGAGVTILSDLVYRPWSLEGDHIEARLLVEDIPDLKIGIASPKHKKMDRTLIEFSNLFREEVGVHRGLEYKNNGSGRT